MEPGVVGEWSNPTDLNATPFAPYLLSNDAQVRTLPAPFLSGEQFWPFSHSFRTASWHSARAVGIHPLAIFACSILPPPSPEWVGERCASAYSNSLVRWRSVCVERDATRCVIATPRPSPCVVVTAPYLISLHVAHSGQQSIQSFGCVLTPLHSLSSFPRSAMTIAMREAIASSDCRCFSAIVLTSLRRHPPAEGLMRELTRNKRILHPLPPLPPAARSQ